MSYQVGVFLLYGLFLSKLVVTVLVMSSARIVRTKPHFTQKMALPYKIYRYFGILSLTPALSLNKRHIENDLLSVFQK
jgi:hypothetical protein